MKKHATRHPITRKYSFQEKKKEVRDPPRERIKTGGIRDERRGKHPPNEKP